MADWAERLHAAKDRRGHNQLQAANAMGVSPNTAYRWFRGECDPDERHQKKAKRYCSILEEGE